MSPRFAGWCLCGVWLLFLAGCPGPDKPPVVDAGQPQDAEQPDTPTPPSDAPADAPDPDTPIPPPFDACPETSVDIDEVCVPDAFLGQNGGPLGDCGAATAPLAGAPEPDCQGQCRGSETFPGTRFLAPSGTPVFSPVAGTVLEAVDGLNARPDPALEGCALVNGAVCCHIEDGPGNHIVLLDRLGTRWMLAHFSAGLDVEVGQVVRAGDKLGAVGDSGWTCAPPGDDAGQLFVSAQIEARGYDPTACMVSEPEQGEAGDCFDADLDTVGLGAGCAVQDCDDTDPQRQSWGLAGCLESPGCADRDGDGGFAGLDCPWPDEDCDDLDPERLDTCQSALCDCLEGPCCDGCRFLGDTVACAPGLRVEYLCVDGEACGSDVSLRIQARHCTGTSAACEGEEIWGEPELAANCTSERRCEDGQPICVNDPSCAVSCTDNNGCEPEQHCLEGACVGDLCPEGERYCAGAVLLQCAEAGDGFEEVERCALGCEGGTCRDCPDNACARLGLDNGEHCIEGDSVTCGRDGECIVSLSRNVCDGAAPVCDGGVCVPCVQDADCPSPLQACDAGQCVCSDACERGDRGCEGAGLRWLCAPDEGGCRHRRGDACGAQAACEGGLCVDFCAPDFCTIQDVTEGRFCDENSVVECGQEGICPVETARARCDGDAPRCDGGVCVECVVDRDCPSEAQVCEGRGCVCEDQCALGESGCQLLDQAWTCVRDDEGCLVREVVDCAPRELCDAGQCILSCEENFCTRGELTDGDHCDGERKVTCRLRDGCPVERTWQTCGCACSEGACTDCPTPDGPLLEIGIGSDGFGGVEDGDVAGVFAGFQGGHHVFGALRVFGLEETVGVEQTWSVIHEGDEIARWSVIRNLRPVDDHHAWWGETVQFTPGTRPETLDGLRATLTVTIVAGEERLHDEVEILLRYP